MFVLHRRWARSRCDALCDALSRIVLFRVVLSRNVSGLWLCCRLVACSPACTLLARGRHPWHLGCSADSEQNGIDDFQLRSRFAIGKPIMKVVIRFAVHDIQRVHGSQVII